MSQTGPSLQRYRHRPTNTFNSTRKLLKTKCYRNTETGVAQSGKVGKVSKDIHKILNVFKDQEGHSG